MVPENQVAEMQGLYGPFTLAERVLQRTWLHGDFFRAGLRLVDGRSLVLLSPGRWSLTGGPDFVGARLRVDGRPVQGDVEIHFRAADWAAHGHARNPAFANVALHVVLFPPAPGEPAQRAASGLPLPTLVLLPQLYRDLEEYASDDALEALTERDDWRRFEALAAAPPAEADAVVRRHAAARWLQKTRYARTRVEKLGWESAAHHTALEILGYRRNRPGMLALAARHPLADWMEQRAPESLMEEGRAYWVTGGQRPANHPRARLCQYQAWVRERPDWPARLSAVAAALPRLPAAGGTPEPTRLARQDLRLAEWRARIALEVTGGALGGSRLDTMVCDGFLPLVAAATGRDLSGLWHDWYLGDVPGPVRNALSRLGLAGTPKQPFCHGLGQGLLGWILEAQTRASAW